jgi:hypothetical protein
MAQDRYREELRGDDEIQEVRRGVGEGVLGERDQQALSQDEQGKCAPRIDTEEKDV